MTEPLIFEKSIAGKKAYSLPKLNVPQPPLQELIPQEHMRKEPVPLPEVSEPEVVRHFTRLSQKNYSVDTNMYPLGSCTMKYNPKINETIVQTKEWSSIHPYQPEKVSQGILKLLYETQNYLCEICGMDAVSLQPAAGAHGEFLGLLLIKAYHKMRKEKRTTIIVSDSSHGTNPSSAHIAGYKVVTVPSCKKGEVDLKALESALDNNTAAVMLTNPNTLGIFESRILKIADMIHKKGALLYGDGANLNAMLGRFRPGDMGFDVIHLNLHKTFSTPHGGGGPGSGPVAVKKDLEPYLPIPRIIRLVNKDNKSSPCAQRLDKYSFSWDNPKSIGRIHSFYGNIGIIIRAYAYIKALGAEGLRKVSNYAVLNANYMRVNLQNDYKLPYDRICMHEFVLSSKNQKKAGNIAKRLLDYGFYAPTVYFPLIVSEALMIEPTETESKETLDKFISTLKNILKENPAIVKQAPHNLPVTKLDEVTAARYPDLKFTPTPINTVK